MLFACTFAFSLWSESLAYTLYFFVYLFLLFAFLILLYVLEFLNYC